MKMSPTFLIWKIIQKICPMVLCAPWAESFIHNWKNYQSIDNKTKMTFCWKYLDNSQNNCDGLTQWSFVTLGPTITHTTSNLNNLKKFFEENQFIDGNKWNHKKWHPRHDLLQICGGRKSVCPFWKYTTVNFQSHPRTSFSINERWSNKYDANNSATNRIRLELITWKIF